MFRNHEIKSGATKTILVALTLTVALASTGCDYGLSALNALGALQGLGDYTDWVDYGFPDSSLYDPTNDIQSVIGYQQEVMDWSANAWDEYILQ